MFGASRSACFRTIKFFDLIDDNNDKVWWDLSTRAGRKLVYEWLLTSGSEATLVLYLDGAQLIDLWNEMEIPAPMRRHWAAVVGATLDSPIIADSEQYRHDEEITNGEVLRDAVRGHATAD